MKTHIVYVLEGIGFALVIGFLIIVILSRCLRDNTPIVTPEPVTVPAEPCLPAAIPAPPDPLRPAVGIRLVGVIHLDATAYHRWSDNNQGYTRRYANDDLDLPPIERRLQEWHYTVALNYDMDAYHRALVRLPDGQITHRFRMHVPGYNEDSNTVSEHYGGDLSWLNGPYFSVPRDRMPAQWKSRIDVLFTGDPWRCRQESRIWGKRQLPVEIWEIVVENSTGIPLTSAETSVK